MLPHEVYVAPVGYLMHLSLYIDFVVMTFVNIYAYGAIVMWHFIGSQHSH